MNKNEEIALVKKVLNLNRENWSIKNMYFNPSFVHNFFEMTQLSNFGFSFEISEVESASGNVVKAALIGPNKGKLDLGSILLDGKSVIIQEDLRTFDEIEVFISNNI